MKNILIASDSFKGTMSSIEIGRIFKKKLKNSSYIPIADGGEGSIDALRYVNKKLEAVSFDGKDTYGNELTQYYYIDEKIAYIETAQICGICEENDVLNSTSEGVGLALKDASLRGINEVYIFLGGTGTNDGGIGILKGLGYMLKDIEGNELLPNTKNLGRLAKIETPKDVPSFKNITLVSDVKNPLLGNLGATYIFGPQKGVTIDLIDQIEKDMNSYARVISKSFSMNKSNNPSSGAAGGISFILMTIYKCNLVSGIELISKTLNLRKLIQESQLVVTGEGKIDEQSFYGKTIQYIIEVCREFNVPYILICGENTLKSYKDDLCKGIFQLIDVAISKNEALHEPAKVLERLIDKNIIDYYDTL